MKIPRGPAMLGIEGCELTAKDRERLAHPLVGGVILFARNFRDCAQLSALTAQIRGVRTEALLIAVDHEGGRVQRFREGFSDIPAMRTLGELHARDASAGAAEAQRLGEVIARELRAQGVDFSFTPVLDLDYGESSVIGDRAFGSDPHAVAHLANCVRLGLRAGGCPAVGKHYPGHGFVRADSHHALPVDERPLADLLTRDLVPFAALVRAGIEAIMPAHVVYPAVDDAAAGFSRIWLGDILRGRFGFDGLIFSDDLGMAGAQAAGNIVARAEVALGAGCDVVLACNEFTDMDELLSHWRPQAQPRLGERWARMEGR
jgi:beta-N-acetylhexosaminidase